MIVSRLFKDGGFAALDTATGIASYSYPTSENATLARTMPERVGTAMIASRVAPQRDYDQRITNLIMATGE